MSFLNSQIQLQSLLPQLSSKRHSFFEDEKEQILQAFMNCPHFKQFKMEDNLKKALEQCYQQISYFLFGENKILHQYGKNSENQFFIIKGEANIYEYKKDSELEIECYYMAQRLKVKDEISSKQNQLKTLNQNPSQNTQNGAANQLIQSTTPQKSFTSIPQNMIQTLQSQLSKEISILEDEQRAIENLLDKKFAFFDTELDSLRDYDQFFIDEVCLLKFVKKLRESDTFGTIENSRDQIIVSATEIHLTNIPTEIYQIYLTPLKAMNEYFSFYLQENKLDSFFSPLNITQKYYNKSEIVYDCIHNKENINEFDPKQDEESIVFKQPTNTIYLVRRGVFQLYKNKDKIFLPIRTLKPGDFFGIEDLFLDDHVFRVRCMSEQGSVLYYSLPPYQQEQINTKYQQEEYLSEKQKNRIISVQQKCLQYYIKIYLDALEYSIENKKNQRDIFEPLMARLLKSEIDDNFRQAEELREKKLIKVEGVIIEMQLEDEDYQKQRFNLRLEPYQVNPQKQNKNTSKQTKHKQSNPSNSGNIQNPSSSNNQQEVSNQQNIPNMNDLVNKLQNKIHSRKQSTEKLILKKRGSTNQQGQGYQDKYNDKDINNMNANNDFQVANYNQQQSDLQVDSFSNAIQNEIQQINQTSSQSNITNRKSNNYQFQPFISKDNSRDITPQNNRRQQKNFGIAPIQSSKDLSESNFKKQKMNSKMQTMSQQNLDDVRDNSPISVKSPIRISNKKQNNLQNNTQVNNQLSESLQNSGPFQVKLAKIKNLGSKKSLQEISASPRTQNLLRQINSIQQEKLQAYSPQSEIKAIQQINQETNKLKIKQNKQDSHHLQGTYTADQKMNSSDSLPYISQNLSSSQIQQSQSIAAVLNNGLQAHVQMANTQAIKSQTNFNAKMNTEGSESTQSRTFNNFQNNFIEKQQGYNYQQSIPSITNLEGNQKQQQINNIYYNNQETPRSQDSSHKVPTKIQSFTSSYDNSIYHPTNKITSSLLFGSNSPQTDKASTKYSQIKSERNSDMNFRKVIQNQKLISIQQKQSLTPFNIQEQKSSNFMPDNLESPYKSAQPQGSQVYIKGLLQSKNELRNQPNAQSQMQTVQGEKSPSISFKSNFLQTSFNQKLQPQNKDKQIQNI